MTIDEKVMVFRMRLEGAALQECADAFGVSRQRISQIVGATEGQRKPGRPAKQIEDCVYPAIATWMCENGHTGTSLAKLCNVSQSTVCYLLKGTYSPTKPVIDKILDATGLTYEVAFKKKED